MDTGLKSISSIFCSSAQSRHDVATNWLMEYFCFTAGCGCVNAARHTLLHAPWKLCNHTIHMQGGTRIADLTVINERLRPRASVCNGIRKQLLWDSKCCNQSNWILSASCRPHKGCRCGSTTGSDSLGYVELACRPCSRLHCQRHGSWL